MALNKCKCGKLLKSKQGERCPVCTRFRSDILQSARSKSMTEKEIEFLTVERTILFRKRMSEMSKEGKKYKGKCSRSNNLIHA